MIELQNVSLSFEGKVLYRDLSLKVPRGGRLLIKGASGTGKTTLLRMIQGFVRPDSGRILIDSEELNVKNVWKLRQKMAWVSQDINMGQGRVEAFIKEIYQYKNNQSFSYDQARAEKLMEAFYLDPSTLNQQLEDLSGGEIQRLAIIITLLLNRDVYLLDEVTSALDQPLKEVVADYFCAMKDQTLVISSHDSVWYDRDIPVLTLENNGSST